MNNSIIFWYNVNYNQRKNAQPLWVSSYLINTELSCLPKYQTSLNVFKKIFKSILDNFRDFQEVYLNGSKTQEGIELLIIFQKKKGITQITYYLLHIHNWSNNYPYSYWDDDNSKNIHFILSDSFSTAKSLQYRFNHSDSVSKI